MCYGDIVQLNSVRASGKIILNDQLSDILTRWRYLTNYIDVYLNISYIKVYSIIFLITITWIYKIVTYRNKIFLF